MDAWLITWEGVDSAMEREDIDDNHNIAAIINPKFDILDIKNVVELIYGCGHFTNFEKFTIFVDEDKRPYKADLHENRITCGHNPHLYARIVKNLHVIDSEENSEGKLVKWDEPQNR